MIKTWINVLSHKEDYGLSKIQNELSQQTKIKMQSLLIVLLFVFSSNNYLNNIKRHKIKVLKIKQLKE